MKKTRDDLCREEYEKEYLEKIITYEDMIYDAGRTREKLDGLWNFQVDPFDSCLRSQWHLEKSMDENGRNIPVDYSFDSWEQIRVPFCWNMQDEKLYYYEGSAVYTRTFNCKNKGENRFFIKFGAANYEAKVFLNKHFMGMHKGGSTPFFLEATEYLEESNRLVVVVDNTRKKTTLPCRNFDWFNYGGLYRDVELIRLPETYIKDFRIALVPDSGYSRISVDIVLGGSVKESRAIVEIEALKIKTDIDIAEGKGSALIEANPHLWSIDDPFLYEVRLTCGSDFIVDSVGFREIKIHNGDILLNGEKIFLKGVCCHEESLSNGRSVTCEEAEQNLRLAKEMNCNFIRLAHYPHSENVAILADRIGILLWEEIPVYWSIDFSDEGTYEDAENQLMELMRRDSNRASVAVWSVGNENEDTDERLRFMSRLAEKAKKYDRTRLVSAACLVDMENLRIADRLAEHIDIIGVNEYFGWYDPDFQKLPRMLENSRPQKPVVITEFGADGAAGSEGAVDCLGTENCQSEIYIRQIAVIHEVEWIKGMCPWILYDFRSPKRCNEMQKGYNIKGLLSADKKHKKPAFFIMQRFYTTR